MNVDDALKQMRGRNMARMIVLKRRRTDTSGAHSNGTTSRNPTSQTDSRMSCKLNNDVHVYQSLSASEWEEKINTFTARDVFQTVFPARSGTC